VLFPAIRGGQLLFSYDLMDCARRLIETERLAAHWAQALPLRRYEVRYEDLVADLAGEGRRLIAFLGLAWGPGCLDFHRTERVVTTASAWQVRQPLYDRSVGRWRHYRRHLGPLLQALAAAGLPNPDQGLLSRHEARVAFNAAAPGWWPRTNCSTSSAKRDCIHPRVGIAEDELDPGATGSDRYHKSEDRNLKQQVSEVRDFALRPGVQRGDSVLFLNQGRYQWVFDRLPGRYAVIAVLREAESQATLDALNALEDHRGLADSGKAAFFAAIVAPDGGIELERRFPSVRFLWQAGELARGFGAGPQGCFVIVNPMLRAIDVAILADHARVLNLLERLPPPSEASNALASAPILILPDVLEPEFCRHLVDVFDRDGGRESGYLVDVDGKSIERFNQTWKRRRDVMLTDPRLVGPIRDRIGRRVCPEIKKAFQFIVSRVERDLVSRYDAETGGHYDPHRDDIGSALAAHRRFAVTIVLNDDFDGGEVSFPEYGPQKYKPTPGSALVFSASILHGVSPVTRGRRYVFLTFLFDEEAEKVRLANLRPVSHSQPDPKCPPSARAR
jgi:hypothetical protein